MPNCYDCGLEATHKRWWQDECPTDRGVEVRNGYEWVCDECDSPKEAKPEVPKVSLEKYIREVVQYCQKNNLDLDNVLEYFRQVWYQEFAKDDPTKAGGNLSSMTKFPERETTPFRAWYWSSEEVTGDENTARLAWNAALAHIEQFFKRLSEN